MDEQRRIVAYLDGLPPSLRFGRRIQGTQVGVAVLHVLIWHLDNRRQGRYVNH